jgi:hypothetical protein
MGACRAFASEAGEARHDTTDPGGGTQSRIVPTSNAPAPTIKFLLLYFEHLLFSGYFEVSDLLLRSRCGVFWRQLVAQVTGQTPHGGDVSGDDADSCFGLDAGAQFEGT